MTAQKKDSKSKPNISRRPQTGKYGKSKNSKLNPNYSTYMAIPLYFIIGLVPLIIFVKKIVSTDTGYLYWDGSTTHYDMFSYYKMVYMLFFAAIGLLIFLINRKNYPFNKKEMIYYVPLGIYSIFVLLSTLASEYKQVALWGYLDRFEGAFVLIGYCIILFLAMNIIKDDKSIKMLFGCLLVSASVIMIIGAFQYYGSDIFKSDTYLKLITPRKLQGGSLKFNFGEKTVFSTLYNPNYVGSYTAMLLPIILIFIIWVKKLWQKLLFGILLFITIINWVGCDSRAGIIGAAAAFVMILFLFRRKILQYKWISIAAVALILCGMTVFNYVTDGFIGERISRMLTIESKGNVNEEVIALDKKLTGLIDISMDNEKCSILTEKGTIQFSLNNRAIHIVDEKNTEIPLRRESNTIFLEDNRFKNIRMVIIPDEGYIEVYYNQYNLINIVLTEDGLRSPSNRWLTYREGRDIETFGFKGMETFGSNRGYIWSRSLPLLKETLLIGKGPDTFAVIFPQYDYLSKLRYYLTGGIFVDKAHNLYLQVGLSTGIVSLLALLALFGIYIVSSIKVLFKEEFTSFMSIAGAACFTAVIGYLVAALFNDSAVSVATVFWVLLGLGIRINFMLGKVKSSS